MAETIVTPRPAKPIDGSSLVAPVVTAPADRPLVTPPIGPHPEQTRPVPQPTPTPLQGFEAIERDRLPIELRDVYDSVASERARIAKDAEEREKAWTTERDTMQQQLKQQNDDYQRVLAALMQMGGAPEGTSGRRTATARAGPQPAAQPTPEPDIDWYDPKQVYG